MSVSYEHFAWPVSPYSAKTRSYLRFKGISVQERVPSAWKLYWTIQRAVGRAVMPTLRCPNGEWLQDSSLIIDGLEERHPEPTIWPSGPRQRLASLLLELHADEWLPMVAMHYRWNLPENHRFAISEFGRYAAPGLPGFLRERLARPIAAKMQSYLPVLGVSDETRSGIERFATGLLQQLEQHFAQHPYLFGARPSLADFSVYGPLFAHLYRDPGSTELFADTPSLRAWMERLQAARPEPLGDFLPEDQVPEALVPIFEVLFAEHFVWLERLNAEVAGWLANNAEAPRLPRALGWADFAVGSASGSRRLITFSLWMLQRVVEEYERSSGVDRDSLDEWLSQVGGQALSSFRLCCRQEVRNFRCVLAKGAA